MLACTRRARLGQRTALLQQLARDGGGGLHLGGFGVQQGLHRDGFQPVAAAGGQRLHQRLHLQRGVGWAAAPARFERGQALRHLRRLHAAGRERGQQDPGKVEERCRHGTRNQTHRWISTSKWRT
jgi:hypothetical protein